MADERHLLVVDDEDVITWAISQGLTKPGEIAVDTASSGEEALEILKKKAFDLVITDIRMKGMNGFELLSHIRTLYPETGVVVMTAYGSAEAKREATERGSLFYLDKTFEMDEMRQVVRSAIEQVDRTRELRSQQDEGFSGEITNLSLVDMVQLHCLARNTANLEVTAGDQIGRIGFQDGEIIYAETQAGLIGEEAFLDMISWSGGAFVTLNEEAPEQNISDSWESLLLEASDVIASAASEREQSGTATSEAASASEAGGYDMHSILEGIAVEKGVLAAFIAGDTGVLIDQAVTSYDGDTETIAELAKSMKVIAKVRGEVEPAAKLNRVIVQFETNRVVALEIGTTSLYLIVAATSAGSLPQILRNMQEAAVHLTNLV